MADGAVTFVRPRFDSTYTGTLGDLAGESASLNITGSGSVNPYTTYGFWLTMTGSNTYTDASAKSPSRLGIAEVALRRARPA